MEMREADPLSGGEECSTNKKVIVGWLRHGLTLI